MFDTVFAHTAFGILPASAQAGVASALATNRFPTPLLCTATQYVNFTFVQRRGVHLREAQRGLV
jgi:hypothetical protein